MAEPYGLKVIYAVINGGALRPKGYILLLMAEPYGLRVNMLLMAEPYGLKV